MAYLNTKRRILTSAHDSSLPSVAPTLPGSPNRVYLASLRFTQILLRRTPDTLGTLNEMAQKGLLETNRIQLS